MKDLEKLFISPKTDLKSIVRKMDGIILNNLPKGIMLVVDENNQLLGTITDGDIRRSFKNKKESTQAKDIMNEKPLFFSDQDSIEIIKKEIPKRLKNRNETSRKFLSNIILVDNKNIPTRMIAYHELWKNEVLDNKKV